ncbi:hypothetical protein AALP_AA3G363800 [Arabis alpina]|uniref:RNA-dependent RNA polymerase n=1 Tax=Arabis alpina TaxID=50452 RepID=A0A087HE08_ARAAL|nr:hypothetical protein AALP_AA3G363800 [Arabis alpina]
MENKTTSIVLPGQIETILEEIYKKHNTGPINDETRKRLSLVCEELASDTLQKILNSKHVFSLDGFIKYFLDQSSGKFPAPAQSPPCSSAAQYRALREEICVDLEPLETQGNGGSLHCPQLFALAELEFKKMFLFLSYIPGQDLSKVISVDEIRQLKDLPMVAYEAAVWNRFGRHFCSQTDRRVVLEWDSGKTRYYQCHVALDGSYTFKGPLLEHTGTHLHKVLGDENVLTVKFADVPKYSSIDCNDRDLIYKRVVKNGIMIGLRRYQFFVFKDGGKEEKKKDFATKGVKCYFIRTDSTSSNDMGNHYIFSGKSIHEARMHFMHVHTLKSLAKYMARFSLILSKTKTLDVYGTGINFEIIDDIHCHDQYGNVVLDKDNKPRIHSDGTGYISEDLARLCPTNIFKGKCFGRLDNIQEACGQEPPLLIQFRMFHDGSAIKGTFLLNKKLPPRTVQVRPSMIKVFEDTDLSNFSTFNSLEVVNTSNPPKRITRLSRNLIALLSYGGVPDDFFMNILLNTLEESKTIFYNKRSALKTALKYGEMDDYNAAEMILVGIPLDEPHLKSHLSTLLKTEKNSLKEGKLPVSESYYLMGTVDPTGELKEDEVCVILESGQISGDVLVYRNPGLHFGDIHVLKATYVKALEEYVGNSKYAVFFPQKGPRSLGDEIAGGDFDGDLYFISRNPELLAHFRPSEPWVSLSTPSQSISTREPCQFSPEDLENELFDMFLKSRFYSSVIGIAADCWLTIMDRFLVLGNDGAEEKVEMRMKMLQLIDIYYDALDAPKKGAKVDLPSELRPDIFPHYMERDKTFKSSSILGLIYDFVESQKTEQPSLPSAEITKLPCFEDEPVSKSHMEKYTQWYADYRADMTEALNTDVSNKDESANEVIQRYKQEFYGAAGFEDSEKSLEELYPQAIALYNIVYKHAIKAGVSRCDFVWKVAGPVLCRLYLKKTKEKIVMGSVSVLKDLWG